MILRAQRAQLGRAAHGAAVMLSGRLMSSEDTSLGISLVVSVWELSWQYQLKHLYVVFPCGVTSLQPHVWVPEASFPRDQGRSKCLTYDSVSEVLQCNSLLF